MVIQAVVKLSFFGHIAETQYPITPLIRIGHVFTTTNLTDLEPLIEATEDNPGRLTKLEFVYKGGRRINKDNVIEYIFEYINK